MKALLYILLFLICSFWVKAETTYIYGVVRDSATSDNLVGVSVKVDKLNIGAKTKPDGSFILSLNVRSEYKLIVSMIGYSKKIIPVTLDKDSVRLEIYLSEKLFRTKEVVISASKRIQAVQEVPISLSIIDSRSLRERGITKIDEALSFVPGIVIKKGNVDIRGSSGFTFGVGSRVSLLIDGFPLLSADNGDMKFDALPIPDIDRIEIIKGAGSALYGSGALGGVINVITKQPDEQTHVFARLYSGIYPKPKYEQWNYSKSMHMDNGFNAGFSKLIDKFGILLSIVNDADDSYRLYDDSEKWNFFGKFNYDLSDETKISVLTEYATDNRTDLLYWESLEKATFPQPGADLNVRFTSKKISVYGKVEHIFDENNLLTVRSGVFRTEFETGLKRNDPDYRQSDANSFNSEIQMNSTFANNFNLTYGLSQTLNTVASAIYGNPDQQILAGYGQLESEFIDNVKVTAGLRYDYEKTTGLLSNSEISPKFGLLYESPFGVNFRFSAGKGFRAPMVVEKYSDVNFGSFTVVANPDLKPESSWSFEIGGLYEFDLYGLPFQADISLFRNELYDMIEPSLLITDIQFQNITRARVTGIEATLKSYMGFAGFETGLTLTDPEDLSTGKKLKYRSEVLWFSRILIPLDFMEFQADYRFQSKVKEIDDELAFAGVKDVNARVPVHIVDARLIFDFKKIIDQPFKLSIITKNLLDYYYTEIVGNLGMTRYLGLQADIDIN